MMTDISWNEFIGRLNTVEAEQTLPADIIHPKHTDTRTSTYITIWNSD